MADETVNVVSPLGSVGSIPSADLERAQREGYRPASDEEVQHAQTMGKYGGLGGAALAGVAGAARGASFGLIDVAGAAFGLDEQLRGLREANPITSTLGEVGGSMLGLGKFAGGGLAARGLRTLSAPARAAIAIGEGVEGVAGSGLFGGVLRAGVEGGLFGLGSATTELALGDDDLTAERLASVLGQHVLSGVGLGAGVGLGFGVAGKVLRGAGSGAGYLVERALGSPTREGVEAVAEGTFGHAAPGIGERVVSALDGPVSVLTGAERGTLASLASPRAQEIAVNAEKVIAGHTDDFVAAMGAVRELEEEVGRQFSGGFKAGQVERLVRTGNEAQTMTAARAVLADMRSAVEDMAASPSRYDVGKWLTGKGGVSAQLADIEQRLAVAEQLGEATLRRAPGGSQRRLNELIGTFNRDLFMDLDGLKRQIGSRAMGYADRGVHGLSPQQASTWRRLQGLYEQRFAPVLEDAALWGDAAVAQAKINAPWKALLDVKLGQGATRGFESIFTSKTRSWEGAQNVLDRKKVDAFLGSITNPAESDGLKALNDWMGRTKDFVDTAAEHLDLEPALRKQVAELDGHLGKLTTARDKVVEAATLRNQLAKLDAADSKGNLIAGAAGLALGAGMLGPASAVGLGALNMLTRPGATIRRVVALRSIVDQYGAQAGQVVTKLFAGAGRQVARSAQPIGALRARVAERQERRQQYDTRTAQLRSYAQNPAKAREELAGALAPLATKAPRSAQMAVERWANAQNYLVTKMPAPVVSRYPMQPPMPPSDFDVDRFLKLQKAIDDPARALLDELDDGALSRETIDAIKDNWPAQFADLQEQVMGELTTMQAEGKAPPYRQRIQIGMLMGAPADPTLEPATMGFVQSTFVPPEITEAKQRHNMGAMAPKMATEMQTEAQRLGGRAA